MARAEPERRDRKFGSMLHAVFSYVCNGLFTHRTSAGCVSVCQSLLSADDKVSVNVLRRL